MSEPLSPAEVRRLLDIVGGFSEDVARQLANHEAAMRMLVDRLRARLVQVTIGPQPEPTFTAHRGPPPPMVTP